jgi:predicted phage-related endonuclease
MDPFRRTAHLGMDAATLAARKGSLGGSDARIIMSGDQAEVEAHWRQLRGEDNSPDFEEMLLIHMGNVTEPLNLGWFEFQTGWVVTDDQKKIPHPRWDHAHATLDGIVRSTPDGPAQGVVEAKFMFPIYWTMDGAVEKYFPQVQHQLMCSEMERGWLSVITGAGQWKKAEIEADEFYHVRLLDALQDFWDCVETGRTPKAQRVNQPAKPKPLRVVDMTGNNEWASLAFEVRQHLKSAKMHDSAKRRLKKFLGDDMAKVHGHGVSIRRGKDGRALWDIEEPDLQPAAEAA